MIEGIKKINFLITRKQKVGLGILIVLLLIGMVLEVFGLGVLVPVITVILNPNVIVENTLISSISEFLGIVSHIELVVSFLLIVLSIYLFKTIFLVFLTFKQNRFLDNITAYLSHSLFKKYLKAPYTFHLNRNSSSLIKNLQIEVMHFSVYCLAFVSIIIEAGLMLAVIGTLIYLEPIGAITIGLFFGILSVIFYVTFKVKLKKWGLHREKLDEQISKTAIESLLVIKDLKVLGREDLFLELYSRFNYSRARISSNFSTISQLPRFYLELVSIIGLVGFIFLMLIKGENPNSLITILGVFVAATFRVIPSLNRILGALQNLKYYNKSIDLLFNEMQIEGESTRNRILNFDFKKEIVFKNVSFKYHPDNDLIFKSLNLKIKKGETIGLIGSSGSGKSTFVDILIGLLSPTSGDVTVDNYKIDKDASSWQKKIGYISQDIHLIDDSIINNIALGVEEDKINLDSVNKAINSAQLQSFIKSLSNGINTHVGDKGVQISGGQKQRIGLARALYHNPEILILDEATSSLDDKTENEVMKAIELLSDDKTVIIIAHRLSTLGFCKKIFELKNSKFKEIKL